MHPRFIIVIGTSAGGLSALTRLLSQFDRGLDAAFCVVVHLSRAASIDFIAKHLQSYTALNCIGVTGEMAIESDSVYVATPNTHLLVKKDALLIGYGPEENRWRPSVDVLFRSAAVAYNSHCIGVVLTGLLNDGTAGMLAIKKSGGSTVVQDPDEADYPKMPKSVIDVLAPDHVVGLEGMGAAIQSILKKEKIEEPPTVPADIVAEARIAENMTTSIDYVKQLGSQTIFSCPDCGGGLWEISQSGFTHFRCHIGHAFSEEDLETKQNEYLESSLWVAVRIMEERKKLMERLFDKFNQKKMTTTAKNYQEKIGEFDTHIGALKNFLFGLHSNSN